MADHTFIEVQRDGKPDRYEAKLLAVSHQEPICCHSQGQGIF
ncbi:MAG: hypothetical protein R3E95_20445 [Thiolinea sp.]